jgi:hypothetical protein
LEDKIKKINLKILKIKKNTIIKKLQKKKKWVSEKKKTRQKPW